MQTVGAAIVSLVFVATAVVAGAAVTTVVVDVRLDGRKKPENSHSCIGNTLCAFFSLSLGRFRLVGTSLILTMFVRFIDFTR